jgi:hypothetical protein
MPDSRKLSPAEMARAKDLVRCISKAVAMEPTANHHEEVGHRLLECLGDIHPDDWPELFGFGGIRGPSYFATAYSKARQARKAKSSRGSESDRS